MELLVTRVQAPLIAPRRGAEADDTTGASQARSARLPEPLHRLRGLIDSIVLIPDDGQFRIELRGNLAAMLTAARKRKGRQKRATFSCRFKWLRGLATAIISSSGDWHPERNIPKHFASQAVPRPVNQNEFFECPSGVSCPPGWSLKPGAGFNLTLRAPSKTT
jgi:hypothetical protein